MAEALSGIVSHLSDLLEGKAASVDRSISRGKFSRAEFDPEMALAAAAKDPRPFEIEELGSEEPFEARYNVAGDYQYFGSREQVRIYYAADPQDQHAHWQTIRRDRRTVQRCLTDPESWSSATGWVNTTWERGEIVPVEVWGSPTAEAPDVLHVLVIDLSITYREAMTT